MPVSQFRTNAISSSIRAVREPNPTQGSALRSERNAGRCSPTAPILADLTVDGKPITRFIQLTSAKPPAFDRQGSTVDNPIDFNSELRAEALELVKATASLIDTSNALSPGSARLTVWVRNAEVPHVSMVDPAKIRVTVPQR